MIVRVGARTYRGEAVDLPGAVDPTEVYEALVDGSSPDDGEQPAIEVEAPAPGAVHEHVGLVDPGVSLSVRAALAAAARSRGLEAPQDEAIAATRAELDDLELPPASTDEARKRVSEAGDRTAELDERVAELRGRVRTLRELDRDASAAEEKLQEAIADLTEARTREIAAQQLLERQRERAREARAVRERRLELEDRLGNLRRGAREHLAGRLQSAFADAVAAVPGEGAAGDGPGSYEGDPVTAALAVVRVADLDAPVVLSCWRFPDAGEARDRLESPVIRIARA